MKVVRATLERLSPYSQSKHHNTPYLTDELYGAYEQRTWRSRLHVDSDGKVFIPPMALKNSISECALFKSEKIPGKGNAKWTKHFEAGILVTEGIDTGLLAADVKGEWLFLNADGRRGGGKRVMRCMPVIPHWKGATEYYLLDEIITKEVFERNLEWAGQIIGIGRFRPRKNGFYGRYKIVELEWKIA